MQCIGSKVPAISIPSAGCRGAVTGVGSAAALLLWLRAGLSAPANNTPGVGTGSLTVCKILHDDSICQKG